MTNTHILPDSTGERPDMPTGYGISKGKQGLLSWEWVREKDFTQTATRWRT